MSNVKENQTDFKERTKLYFRGVKSEWGKITWPQKPQIFAETFIVLIIVFFLSAAVYVIDIGFKGLFHFLKLT